MRTLIQHFLSKLGVKHTVKSKFIPTGKGKNSTEINKHQNQHGRTAANTTSIPRHFISEDDGVKTCKVFSFRRALTTMTGGTARKACNGLNCRR